MKRLHVVSIVLIGLGCLAVAGSALAQAVVMSGLDNPRGLAFSPERRSVCGGSGPRRQPARACPLNGAGEDALLWKDRCDHAAVEGPAVARGGGPGVPMRFPTGRRRADRTTSRSRAPAAPTSPWGSAAAPSSGRPSAASTSAPLIHMAASGKWKVVADVCSPRIRRRTRPAVPSTRTRSAFSLSPVAVWSPTPARMRCFSVAANGRVETVAVFPPLPNPTPVGPPMVEAVPTAVARGPDGALYVGQLTGFPFAPGVANIYRVVPGQDPVVHCTGFKAIMDLAFGSDGSLYVVENATGGVPPFGLFFLPNTGRLSRVAPDCTVTPLLEGLESADGGRRGRRRSGLCDQQRRYGWCGRSPDDRALKRIRRISGSGPGDRQVTGAACRSFLQGRLLRSAPRMPL